MFCNYVWVARNNVLTRMFYVYYLYAHIQKEDILAVTVLKNKPSSIVTPFLDGSPAMNLAVTRHGEGHCN